MLKQEIRKKQRYNLFSLREKNWTTGLIELCRDHIKKSMIGVEVGSFRGASSEVLAFYCKELICVDPWNLSVFRGYKKKIEDLIAAEKEFDKMLKKVKNIKKEKDFSLDYVKRINDESLDFVYIDGAHDYANAKADIQEWSKKVKKGGVVSGHDYDLINKVIFDLNLSPKIYKDSSWVYYK